MPYLVAALLGSFFALNSFATPGRVERMTRRELLQRYPGAQVRVKVAAGRGLPIVEGQFDRFDVEITHFTLDAAAGPGAVPALAPVSSGQGDARVLPAAANGSDFTSVARADAVGRVGHAAVRLRDFSVQGLPIEATDLDVDEIAFDWSRLKARQQFALVSAGPATVRVTVPAATLLKYLGPRLRDVRDAQVSLRDGEFRLCGRAMLPWLHWGVPFTFKTELEVRGGNEIWLRDPGLGLTIMAPYSVPVGRLLAGLNPVYVFDRGHRWPVRVRVSDLELQDDRMTVTAGLALAPSQS